MSIGGAEILNNLEELSEKENPNIDDTKYEESLDYLNIKNNYHMKLLSSIKLAFACLNKVLVFSNSFSLKLSPTNS